MRSLLLLFALACCCRADAIRPNILILFSDDQRADTIGALGNPHVHTPNLDALVKRGTAFTRAYCMGANNGAVCIPSRAMLMTGRTLWRISEKLQGQTTWPEQFAAAGWTTFITGKWHNGEASVRSAFQQGKAIFFGGMTEPVGAPVCDLGPGQQIINRRKTTEHSVKVFADSAIDFLRQQKPGGSPFVCYVAFNHPHDPRTAPAEYMARAKQNPPPLPPNFLPEHPFENGALKIRDELLAPHPRTEEVVRQHLTDYYACIDHLDFQAGRILAALREGGLEENTIVVFSSDHGLAIGSHGLFGKQNLYEHSMRAPLIFAGPGIPKGEQRDSFAYLLDIFPTLGAMAKVTAPDGSEGINLFGASKRDTIFTSYINFQRAIRDNEWKLIDYPKAGRRQLFNFKEDPAEIKDIIATAPKEVTQRMEDLLRKAQAQAGDPLAPKVETQK